MNQRLWVPLASILILGAVLSGPSAFAESQSITSTTGTFTPAAPPKMDRAQSSKAAAVFAQTSAEANKTSCLMMMNQAMQEEDKDKQMMLMMMASQACSQANQMGQSAQQNNQNADQLGDDIPAAAKFTAGTTSVQNGAKENYLTFDDAVSKSSSGLGDDGDVPVSPTFQPPAGNSGSGEGAGPSSALQNQTAQINPPSTTLSPIKAGNVGFNDAGKQGVSPMTGSMPMGMMGMGGSGGANGNAQSASSSAPAGGSGEEKTKRNVASDAGSGGGGDSEKSGGGDETLSALMNQLMGDKEIPEDAPIDMGFQLVSGKAAAAQQGERANIFEYASVRYQKLKVDDRRLGVVGAKEPVAHLAGH